MKREERETLDWLKLQDNFDKCRGCPGNKSGATAARSGEQKHIELPEKAKPLWSLRRTQTAFCRPLQTSPLDIRYEFRLITDVFGLLLPGVLVHVTTTKHNGPVILEETAVICPRVSQELTSEMTLVYLKRAYVQSPVLPLLSEVIFTGPVWSPYTARENPTDNQLAAGELTPALMSPLRSKALKQQRNNWATTLLYPSYKWCSLVCLMQMRSSFRAARFPMVLRYKSTCVYFFQIAQMKLLNGVL